jgi:hypothetical protein
LNLKTVAPFASQNVNDWEALAGLVGNRNYNIRYSPQFISEPSAQAYIDRNAARAKTEAERKRWANWAVAQADLDDNPATPQRYGIASVPTLNVYQGGEVVKSLIGAMRKPILLDQLAEYLG